MIPRAAPLLEVKELSSLQGYRTSCPLSKALITLCRGEISERICRARTVTKDSVCITLSEKEPLGGVEQSHLAEGETTNPRKWAPSSKR